jgi:hypothetical protein
MESAFTTPLVTADDDVIYPSWWLSGLLGAHQQDADTVICYRARVISLEISALAPYDKWQLCTSTASSFRHFATGVAGVLYPVDLQYRLKAAGASFVDCCPRADDIWLHANALRAGFRVRQVFATPADFPEIPQSQVQALFRQNQVGGQNDRQAAATYSDDDLQVLRQAPNPS